MREVGYAHGDGSTVPVHCGAPESSFRKTLRGISRMKEVEIKILS
jgi:hypothetical protein